MNCEPEPNPPFRYPSAGTVKPAGGGTMREQHGIRVRFVVVAAAWLASAGLPVAAAVSDPPAVPVASAVRARGPIVVDGRLGEETWSVARPIADLVQRQP